MHLSHSDKVRLNINFLEFYKGAARIKRLHQIVIIIVIIIGVDTVCTDKAN